MLRPQDLFDLSEFAYADIFDGCAYAWEAIGKLEQYIKKTLSQIQHTDTREFVEHGVYIENNVIIGKGTIIEPGVFIKGPSIIGENCQIRQGAYFRGDVIIGNNCVVGHATEIKHSILLNHAAAAHFAYIGDSILGNRVDLGAGTKLANQVISKIHRQEFETPKSLLFPFNGQRIDTHLEKLGAMIGDDVKTGCQVVTNPGCVIGPRTVIYPLISLAKGFYDPDSIIKLSQKIAILRSQESFSLHK
jgi:UDP-N-acetylglucosamine diphosphorylase / glucose-1-phosphate thymidylyltransferase / UDP-N-acetylgalactosamine diphosphorylase / glucosamine-1-phosphate N-acetyltransferase / galactosamine-1-phosphate N-acetyltransferase